MLSMEVVIVKALLRGSAPHEVGHVAGLFLQLSARVAAVCRHCCARGGRWRRETGGSTNGPACARPLCRQPAEDNTAMARQRPFR